LSAVVQETRSAFQEAVQHHFIAEIQRHSGRRVLAFISNRHVGPDLEVELLCSSRQVMVASRARR
jgi:hypothetical protein